MSADNTCKQLDPYQDRSCVDLESFVRGGPTLTTIFFYLVDGMVRGIEMPLKVDHHRPASETPFRWRADNGPQLNAGLVAL